MVRNDMLSMIARTLSCFDSYMDSENRVCEKASSKRCEPVMYILKAVMYILKPVMYISAPKS